MFCKYCGANLTDDSVFCSKCGKNLGTNMSSTSTMSQVRNSLPSRELLNERRKGIGIYLDDICALEFSAERLYYKLQDLQKKSKSLYNKYYVKDYPIVRLKRDENHHSGLGLESKAAFVYNKKRELIRPQYWTFQRTSKEMFRFLYDGKDIYFCVYSPYPVEDAYLIPIQPERMMKLTADNLRKFLTKLEFKRFHGFNSEECAWALSTSVYDNLKNYINFANHCRDVFEKSYNDFVQCSKTKYEELLKKNKQLQFTITKIQNELNCAEDLLDEEYSLNLIPNNFRNIGAVYYIREYYNSSQESLSSIFLHLDLEEIKRKLDIIIQNQEQILINQAILKAQNKKICSDNEKLLSKLASIDSSNKAIAQNTEESVNWARVAANNAEACAFLSLANYIRK